MLQHPCMMFNLLSQKPCNPSLAVIPLILVPKWPHLEEKSALAPTNTIRGAIGSCPLLFKRPTLLTICNRASFVVSLGLIQITLYFHAILKLLKSLIERAGCLYMFGMCLPSPQNHHQLQFSLINAQKINRDDNHNRLILLLLLIIIIQTCISVAPFKTG